MISGVLLALAVAHAGARYGLDSAACGDPIQRLHARVLQSHGG